MGLKRKMVVFLWGGGVFVGLVVNGTGVVGVMVERGVDRGWVDRV